MATIIVRRSSKMILLDGILAFVLWLVDLTAWLEIKKENIKAKRLLATGYRMPT